eukprot:CAMPEP_0119470604 /NCGR_PEP_ID=MMETSP1344-20130328/3435_1 /TAXON_ID=236787 /ORGANISM="Florenciella parvula, Strain CCMP2471" /LENGTH=63 /DNA_ID=CAMNT_0007503299 /DNA_START=260 /DNA_END=448 /DNA_ORIENTATION=-
MPLQSLLGIVVAHCWWIPVLRAYFPCPDGVEPKMVEVTPDEAMLACAVLVAGAAQGNSAPGVG